MNSELQREKQIWGGGRIKVCWRMWSEWRRARICSMESMLSQKPHGLEGVSGGDWLGGDSASSPCFPGVRFEHTCQPP